MLGELSALIALGLFWLSLFLLTIFGLGMLSAYFNRKRELKERKEYR